MFNFAVPSSCITFSILYESFYKLMVIRWEEVSACRECFQFGLIHIHPPHVELLN